jgi:hypothetical protein
MSSLRVAEKARTSAIVSRNRGFKKSRNRGWRGNFRDLPKKRGNISGKTNISVQTMETSI